MPIEPFQSVDAADVGLLHDLTFAGMPHRALEWRPCEQVESLDRPGVKIVARAPQLVGYAAAFPLDATHWRLNLLVSPTHLRQGIGSQMLTSVEAAVRLQGGRFLQARMLEHMPVGLAFARARGFGEVHRMRGMTLQARDVDADRWTAFIHRAHAQGFRSTTYAAELAAGHQPLNKLMELQRHASAGWLSPDPTWQIDLTPEALQRAFSTIRVPEHVSMMTLGDAYVAYTSADRANGLGTAVHPYHRGRGVATALKAENLTRCIAAGQHAFETSSANPAMLGVNERLGYRYNGLTEIRLVKEL